MSAATVVVVGVGMIPFVSPSEGRSYDDLGSEAVQLALQDAGLTYDEVNQAFASYVFGDSCAGQRVLYRAGLTGIPIFNVHNNCASGSTALYLARQAVASGAADCVLAVGFEQMRPGPLGIMYQDRVAPFEVFDTLCSELVDADVPLALRYFGGAGIEHMNRHGTTLEDFAKVRAKASRHAVHNPNAIFRRVMTADDVLATQELWPGVMTRAMACPPTSGAAAALLTSRDFAARHGLDTRVRIAAQAMGTDGPGTFAPRDMIHLIGSEMAARTAQAVYNEAGVGPEDIRIVELHDCFAQNEVITYEALGLCPQGGAAQFIADGDNSYGGQVVTNPSGGLLSKGHPLGATGLAQCYELVHQLRGSAGARQVDGDPIHALQHNMGLGGACVVTLYERH